MKIFEKKTIYGCEARGDDKDPYLTRWEIISTKWFAVYLHKFHRSDDNSSLHDHPWDFITIPISVGYNNCTYRGVMDENGKPTFNRELMKPFSIKYRPASHIHFVELLDNRPAWTIIIRGKYVRYWGFWKKGIFTQFDKYFKENGC